MLLITEEASDSRPSNGELNDFQILETYLDEDNHHIAITASNNGIPYAEVHLDKEYTGRDGVPPEGYEVIAERLWELGYSPFR